MTDQAFPEASESTAALILGVLTFPMPVLGPFAWFFGHREVSAIDAGRRDPVGRREANFGRIVGMVATIMAAAVLAFVVFALLLALIAYS